MYCRDYHEAVEHFSAILSLNSVDSGDILAKRDKAYAMMDSEDETMSSSCKVYVYFVP